MAHPGGVIWDSLAIRADARGAFSDRLSSNDGHTELPISLCVVVARLLGSSATNAGNFQLCTQPAEMIEDHFLRFLSNRVAGAADLTPMNDAKAIADVSIQSQPNEEYMTAIENNSDPSQVPRGRVAYETVRNEIASVPDQDFVGITLDVATAVYTVIGKWAQIQTLRPLFVQYLPGFDISVLDKLETYALALGQAQTEYKTVTDAPPSVVELGDKAINTRAVLLADVKSLIVRGLIPANSVDNLQGTNGYKNVVADVFELANILRVNQDKVAGRTSVTTQELNDAENLADELRTEIAEREQTVAVAAETVHSRQAAYTLFINAYEEVRGAVQYLRRKDGDADDYTPSLFAGRGGRPRKNGGSSDQPQPAPAPNPPAPANGHAAAATPAVTTPTATQPDQVSIAAHGPFVS